MHPLQTRYAAIVDTVVEVIIAWYSHVVWRRTKALTVYSARVSQGNGGARRWLLFQVYAI